jgi:Double zinc ribbon
LITCVTCGADNEVDAAFCGACGSPLDPVASVPADSPTEVVSVPGAAGSSANDPRGESGSSLPAIATVDGAVPESAITVVEAGPPVARTDPWAPAGGATSEDGTPCPSCGTLNDAARAFCRKCATELRPGPIVKRSLVNRGLVVRFVASAALSAVVVITGAALITRLSPGAAAARPSPNAVEVADPSGEPVEFGLVQGDDPEPLPALPDDATIKLASYDESAPAPTPQADGTPGRARWWSDGFPRIPAVSQFDGGPLQSVNCVMAAGAMLARLSYGIVTTGSQLRALSGDPEGGTSFQDLQNALFRGWGIKLSLGALRPVQLRALLYAGAGAEVIVDYGAIPNDVRLQTTFDGNHAIYLDGFREGPGGEPQYYVMDPIGRTWSGYRGEWWSAVIVERAAMAFGGGRIATAWAFAGGKIPFNHPRLPVTAYPSDDPPSTQDPLATVGPGGTGGPRGSAGPFVDPLPSDDVPLDPVPPVGEPPPPDRPKFPTVDFVTGFFEMYPDSGGTKCTQQPLPAGCPTGIVGIIDLLGGTIVSGTSPPGAIDLMYANPIAPDTYQIIYASPIDSASSLLLWQSSGGGTLEAAKVESGILNGTEVKIATITLDPNIDYSFIATTETDGIRSTSDIGSLLVKS